MPKLKPGSSGGGDTTVIPGGEYLLALVSFSRKQSKSSDSEYLRCKFEVCAGAHKGARFWSTMFLSLDKPGTVMRWNILMESCGVQEEFEVGSIREGNQAEGDANIRSLFVGKPFKAQVTRERSGEYENNDLEKLIFPRNWTEHDRSLMGEWQTEYLNRADDSGHFDQPYDGAEIPNDPQDGADYGPPADTYEDSYAPAGDDGEFDPANF